MPHPCWYCKLVQPWSGSHYHLLILENPRNMTCGIYLSMACQVSYPAISKRGQGSYSLVKVSIYKRVGRSRQSCKLHTLKGVPFLNRRYKIGVPYLLKIVYKKGKGLGLSVYNFSWGSLPSGLQGKKKEHYLVANRSSRSLDLLRGSGMLSVLTLLAKTHFFAGFTQEWMHFSADFVSATCMEQHFSAGFLADIRVNTHDERHIPHSQCFVFCQSSRY